jgi:hypothetical protein
LKKKTRGEKSRGTVPLKSHLKYGAIHLETNQITGDFEIKIGELQKNFT